MILKILLIILAVIVITALACLIMLTGNVKNLRRVDADGYLYSCDFVRNYTRNPLSSLPLKFFTDVGCSTFVTHSNEGDVLTGRNYDFPHLDNNGNVTGLNIILNFAPKNRYKSTCLSDASLLSAIGLPYFKGALDTGKPILFPLTFLPYLCMDGINEKGLTASILALDVKNGEHSVSQKIKGRKKCNITQFLRYSLDNCSTVEEVIDLASKYNMVNTRGNDYHLFVTDENDSFAVLEWRYNELRVARTDAATNFYVGFDDGQDVYRKDGTLKEAIVRLENLPERYQYGYGHGFSRYNTLVKGLMFATVSDEPYYTRMSSEEAMYILEDCSQEYDEESPTSCTQYSVVYNNTQRNFKVSGMRDYKNIYNFSVKS